MHELISAFEEIIELLKKSEDTIWANYTVEEAVEILQIELENYKKTQKFSESGKNTINLLFLPTGALQEISIDNGWGNKFVKIADVFDKYL